MIDYYFSPGPNPIKVSLFLEESGLPYKPISVDLLKGEHLTPSYSRLNPNNKVPAIIDDGVPVFDSNAILLYLADKHHRFLPKDPLARGSLLSWLMFVASGLGPFSGQAVHFKMYAPEPKEYPLHRYTFEARRHYQVLEGHLADKDWMVDDTYTIVDMAVWGWIRHMDLVVGESAKSEFPNVTRLLEKINGRPAAPRALALLKDHNFTMEFDQEALDNLYRHKGAVQPSRLTFK
jgi:GSH-dependent disulfide-bond oxidoreductase